MSIEGLRDRTYGFITFIPEDSRVQPCICRCHYRGSSFSSVLLRPWTLAMVTSLRLRKVLPPLVTFTAATLQLFPVVFNQHYYSCFAATETKRSLLMCYVKCFRWLMESVRVIFLWSSSTVVQPAPLTHVRVIKMTTLLHYQLKKAMGQDVAMFTI